MPFVSIRNSSDMLEFLTEMALESNRTYDHRRFQTVVIDTLDAFQRKVMDEWLLANPGAGSFRGYDAWGYLDAKMGMLLTRLLNLDMNVIVNCHYTDKTIKEGSGETASERQELQLQLSGAIKDRVFNDFDLVGWIGKYYEAVDGQRVEKRGLTFKSDDKRPFLKDRLYVTPEWMEIKFADSDYETLFSAFSARLDEFAPTEVIGEITPLGPEMGAGGIDFSAVAGGPVEPIDPKDIPLSQFDKPTLQKIARDEGVTEMPDGVPIKSNTLKGELITAIEHARAQKAAATPPEGDSPAATSDATVASDAAAPEVAPSLPALAAPEPAGPVEGVEPVAPAEPVGALTPAVPAVSTAVQPAPLQVTKDGITYDPATGVVVEATEEQALAALGGEVISQGVPAETPTTAAPVTPSPVTPSPVTPPAPAASLTPGRPSNCQNPGCKKDLAAENQDYVKLSQIKFRLYFCNSDYLDAKNGKITTSEIQAWKSEVDAR